MNKQIIAAILLCIGLSSCGQKGPLTHPQPAPNTPEQEAPATN